MNVLNMALPTKAMFTDGPLIYMRITPSKKPILGTNGFFYCWLLWYFYKQSHNMQSEHRFINTTANK